MYSKLEKVKNKQYNITVEYHIPHSYSESLTVITFNTQGYKVLPQAR